jgi:hypothetical protein
VGYGGGIGGDEQVRGGGRKGRGRSPFSRRKGRGPGGHF